MGARVRLPGFVGPWNANQAVVSAPDRLVNWLPAAIEPPTGTAPWAFDPAPGCGFFVEALGSPTRGSFELNGTAYLVSGSFLQRVIPGGGLQGTALSTIAGTGRCSIASNGEIGSQIMVASNTGVLYWLNTTINNYGQISTVTGQDVVFMDGYFIALDPDTSTIYVSDLADGTTWNALNSEQRSDLADKWRRMIVRGKDLLLFGSESLSVYYDSGVAGVPFVPNQSIAINRGIYADGSLALLQNHPIWLADDLTVRYMPSYAPQRVSTHAIEYAISQFDHPDDAVGMVYNEQGHSVYVLTFVQDDVSFAYDLTTGLWHQRAEGSADDFGALTVGYAVAVGDITLVGSLQDAYVYYWSETYPYDPSQNATPPTPMTRMRRAPSLVNDLNRTIYDEFELFMEVGTANAVAPGNTPTVLLQWSNDGGQTFNTGVSASAGTHAAWNTRVIWRQLGQGRQRVFQVTVSDPIQWRLVDAYLRLRIGSS